MAALSLAVDQKDAGQSPVFHTEAGELFPGMGQICQIGKIGKRPAAQQNLIGILNLRRGVQHRIYRQRWRRRYAYIRDIPQLGRETCGYSLWPGKARPFQNAQRLFSVFQHAGGVNGFDLTGTPGTKLPQQPAEQIGPQPAQPGFGVHKDIAEAVIAPLFPLGESGSAGRGPVCRADAHSVVPAQHGPKIFGDVLRKGLVLRPHQP